MRPGKLSNEDVQKQLKCTPEWNVEDGAIAKTFEFVNFAKAMQFVNYLAETAEDVHHHPDIEIKYNKVRVVLSTHDAGGLTELDFNLAAVADDFAETKSST